MQGSSEASRGIFIHTPLSHVTPHKIPQMKSLFIGMSEKKLRSILNEPFYSVVHESGLVIWMKEAFSWLIISVMNLITYQKILKCLGVTYLNLNPFKLSS